MQTILRIIALLEPRERWRLLGLTACILIMAMLEMIGVASILPFMQLVSNPDAINENQWLAWGFVELGFTSPQAFLLFVGLMLVMIIGLSNGFSAFTTWMMFRFAWGQNHRLSMRLLARYLARPYSYYLGRNTSVLIKNVLAEVQTVNQGIILAGLRFISRALVAILITAFLAVIDPLLAFTVGGVLGGAYGLVYVLLRRKQRRLGRLRMRENGRRYQVAGEALSGIKEVKVLGREVAFLQRFKEPSWRFSRAATSSQVVARMPRYALETVAFGGILLIVLYFLRSSTGTAGVLPVISLYAFAGYKLLPALDEMFSTAIQVRFNLAALDDVHLDLMEPVEHNLDMRQRPGTSERRLSFNSEIHLRNVSFAYPETERLVLKDINIAVRSRETVGFVGETGAGKTTLVDLILGLLEPTQGSIQVDGAVLDAEGRRAWRRACGYIPQSIFLCDDTVRSNIAFGISEKEIDQERVVRAAEVAQIHEFIQSLPAAFDTKVGERGVRLSGGQRQRIGIARALYHDPDVLVMDEATSSLDGITESAVMEMIHSLGRKKTLIVIAHRLSTVRACDIIHVLHEGEIVASGAYDNLVRTNERFRTMAGVQAS